MLKMPYGRRCPVPTFWGSIRAKSRQPDRTLAGSETVAHPVQLPVARLTCDGRETHVRQMFYLDGVKGWMVKMDAAPDCGFEVDLVACE